MTLSDLEITRFFLALVVLLASAHGIGYFFQRILKIPKVIGEICAGLILGPSLLGWLYPVGYEWLFNAFSSEGQLLAVMYWIGLVLLMFISGFEIQKTLHREDRRLIVALLIGATTLPFLAGWFLPQFHDVSRYLGESGNMLSLTLVIAIAIAVTSIPVISKIFIDLGIIQTRFAKIVLATATIEDVILWIALAVATGLVSGESPSIAAITWKVFGTFGLFVAALFLIPRFFERVSNSRYNLVIKSSATGYVLLVCFLFAVIANMLSVNVIFGAFLAGIVVGMTSNAKIASVKAQVSEIGLGFFIPLYFAIVGLKLNVVHHFDVSFFIGFLAFAVIVKATGTILAARMAGQKWLPSINLAVAMNARGGPGIVLATVAFDFGIINETLFGVLLVVAVVTSAAAGYWFRFILARKWPLFQG